MYSMWLMRNILWKSRPRRSVSLSWSKPWKPGYLYESAKSKDKFQVTVLFFSAPPTSPTIMNKVQEKMIHKSSLHPFNRSKKEIHSRSEPTMTRGSRSLGKVVVEADSDRKRDVRGRSSSSGSGGDRHSNSQLVAAIFAGKLQRGGAGGGQVTPSADHCTYLLWKEKKC